MKFGTQMKFIVLGALLVAGFGMTGCGEKAFVKGNYESVEKENLLNDQWSETDMQQVVADLVGNLTKHPAISAAPKPPLLMVTKLQNKTSEHIDTQSIMDMVKNDLMGTGRVLFVDKESRQDVSEEYDYQNSGMVSQETKKGPGGQLGADYVLGGRLDSIVQEVGKDKTVYYKVTLLLTNLKTNVSVWSGQKQLRKAYKKKSVGM